MGQPSLMVRVGEVPTSWSSCLGVTRRYVPTVDLDAVILKVRVESENRVTAKVTLPLLVVALAILL